MDIRTDSMHFHLISIPAKKKSVNAFTLIELLAVTVVVLVLTGITFGISKGVLNRQARAQARAELAMIAQALEEFKLTYGDYPVVSEGLKPDGASDDSSEIDGKANSRLLTQALAGFLYVEQGPSKGTRVMTEVDNAKTFIDTEKMNFSEDFGAPLTYAQLNENSFLVDPWREPYIYVCNKGKADNNWNNAGYVLFSKGPDRAAVLKNGTANDDIQEDGIIDQTHLSQPENVDNIYPNQ